MELRFAAEDPFLKFGNYTGIHKFGTRSESWKSEFLKFGSETEVFETVVVDRYIEMLLDMCGRVMKDERQSEKEARTAVQLTMVVLHNCKGRIDEYIPPILAMLSERVRTVSDGVVDLFFGLRQTAVSEVRVTLAVCTWNPMCEYDLFMDFRLRVTLSHCVSQLFCTATP